MLKTCTTPKYLIPQLFILVLIVAAAAFLFAMPAAASTPGGGSNASWGAFFGRTHILFLHLPIGLLIGAFTIELFGFFKRSRGFDIAAAWLFVLGFMSCIGAVVTGMLLGTEKAGDESLNIFTLLFADADKGVSDTLSLHMWLGLTMMVVAGVAAVLKILAVQKQWKDKESAIPERGGWPLGVARVSLVGVMVAMPFVGHLGGNMTRGPEYLTERAPAGWLVGMINVLNAGTVKETTTVGPRDSDPEVDLVNGTAAFWDAKIQPVLNVHCTDCHNAADPSGKLRLDSLEEAMKGGRVGGTIEPGDAEFSEIYRRVILPPSHDEFMPPTKKIPVYGMMSQEDIHILGEWLTEFDGKIDRDSGTAAVTEQPEPEPEPEPVKPVIDPGALNAITAAGANALSLSQEENPDLLDVKFAYLSELDPAVVANLESGKDNIAWLTFEGSAFGDEAAKALPDMAKLERLNLKDSAITDVGLAELPEMPTLSWMNLFGTEVTDAGLESLKKYGALEKLYLTGTQVSADGVSRLREAMPDTEIFSDHDGAFQFNPVTPEGDGEGDKAAAKPVNDKCPVSGAPIKPGFVSTFEDKTVGFCCNNCKSQFDADPNKFKAKLQ